MNYWKNGLGNDITLPERELLYKLAKEVNPGVIVNIGVNRGTSLHCIAAGAPDSEIYGIDIQFRTEILSRERIPDNVKFIEANSTTYNEIEKADFVFVDGSHEYVMVKDDILNWSHRVNVGGFIAFHDYGPKEKFIWRLGGVKRAVNEWEKYKWEDLGTIGSIIAFRRFK